MGSNTIVTGNLVFVSSRTKVYALDLNTHKPVWTFPKPGLLALSPNGVLYMTTTSTTNLAASVYAINLNWMQILPRQDASAKSTFGSGVGVRSSCQRPSSRESPAPDGSGGRRTDGASPLAASA